MDNSYVHALVHAFVHSLVLTGRDGVIAKMQLTQSQDIKDNTLAPRPSNSMVKKLYTKVLSQLGHTPTSMPKSTIEQKWHLIQLMERQNANPVIGDSLHARMGEKKVHNTTTRLIERSSL